MPTIEQYWDECVNQGYIRERTHGKVIYRLPSHMGQGGFEIWGDTTTAMATFTDATLYKPMVMVEHVSEKYMQFSQFYTGKAEFYQKRSDVFPIDHGLNYFVHHTGLFGYKRVEAGMRLVDVGIFYRSKFFDTLPFPLPEDFWETAANVLNPDVIALAPITMICDQIKNCRLTGNELNMFVYGKAFEAFAITLDYVYAHRQGPPVYLCAQDRAALEEVKQMLRQKMDNPPGIAELSASLGMNQRKLMAGFKHLNGMTVYNYLKHIRMEKAAELLRRGDRSILDVAHCVGYHGDGHFQRAFRDVYGIAPSKFRREVGAG